MAPLTKIERTQLRRKAPRVSRTVRWEVRPMAEYLAFATFASRLKPTGQRGVIEGGKHWKL